MIVIIRILVCKQLRAKINCNQCSFETCYAKCMGLYFFCHPELDSGSSSLVLDSGSKSGMT